MGQRQCGCLEVIEHVDFGKSQCRPQFDAIDLPPAIGEGAAPALDRAGNGKHGARDRRLIAVPVQERVYGIGKSRELTHFEPLDGAEGAIGQQSESGIRRSDVTQ
jgi:hypothetical protein